MTFDISKIAHLARLKITEEEQLALEPKLNNIMQLISDLQQVDTGNMAPLANPLEMHQRLRDDVVTEQDHHQEYQKIAPMVVAGLYIVPKVIE